MSHAQMANAVVSRDVGYQPDGIVLRLLGNRNVAA